MVEHLSAPPLLTWVGMITAAAFHHRSHDSLLGIVVILLTIDILALTGLLFPSCALRYALLALICP